MDQTILILGLAVAGTALIYAITAVVRRRRYGPSAPARPSRISRGAGPAAAPGGASPDAGITDAVRFLRRLGFFASEQSEGDEDLARRLEQRIEEEWGAPLADVARTPAGRDMLVALEDPSRAYRAPDAYFYQGDDTYLEIITRCGALEGIPPLTGAGEEWAGPDGPVEIRFTVAGQLHSYTVQDPKYIDAGLFGALNDAATDAPRRLRMSDALGMPNVVLALSDAEADLASRERGWSFHPAAP